jgi:hypothetical protein
MNRFDEIRELIYNGICIKIHIEVKLLYMKKDPFNQYKWMEISSINSKKIYTTICYFVPINSTFYKKNNLDKNCTYNVLDMIFIV